MSEPAGAPRALPEGSEPGAPGSDQSVLESVKAAWHDLRGLAHDQLQLAALEAQRAGRSAVAIVAYGVAAGLLIASAWLGMAVIVVMVLITLGIDAVVAVSIAVMGNVLGALGFVLAIRRRSRDLGFPASLRSLDPGRRAPALTEQES